MTEWHKRRMLAFDLETTGIDVEADRIVTAAVIGLGGNEPTAPQEWLADPGIDIPEGATAVHGISTEHARKHGERAADVVDQVAASLAAQTLDGAVVVGHNVVYDFTLLDRECARHDVPSLADRLDGQPITVIDTRVVDQFCLPYRRRVSETQGARQLITLAQVYDLPWNDEQAHGCSYDALIAARVAYRIGTLAHMPKDDWPAAIRAARRPRFHHLEGLELAALHELQVGWAAEQAASLQDYFRKKDPEARVAPDWPLIPRSKNGDH
ncbi:exonuclease domain-containing protein [Streptomyces sp. NPDC059352]|uniref:exonuclease domain-containing protein n=1 Tax=Streptomyces sp. NPDC059352 TaxID=3346810 RepID=UPI0036AA910B